MRALNTCNRVYDLTSYDGHEVVARTIDREGLEALDPQQFDHFIATHIGVFAFRNELGRWIEYSQTWPRLGPVGIKVIRALQLNPGDFLTPRDIAELTSYDSLRQNENLAARICAIRKSHQDTSERFFETRRAGGYAVRWQAERTWVWVERILEDQ